AHHRVLPVHGAGAYDAVLGIHALGHQRSPFAQFAVAGGGGRSGAHVVAGVPHAPPAVTRFPSNPANAPRPHLTCPTHPDLAVPAERHGAAVESIENVPWGDCDSLLYWMERCSPLRCRDIFYRNRPWWHAAVLIGLAGGWLIHRLRGTPRTTDEGVGLLMVARRGR